MANLLIASDVLTGADWIEDIENKIDMASDLLNELNITKNSILGIKNKTLIILLEKKMIYQT